MRRYVLIALVPGILALAAAAGAEPTAVAVSVVDRAFLCAPIAYGGQRDLDVEVRPRSVDKFGRPFAPLVDVRSGGSLDASGLVFVRASKQPWAWGLAIPWPLRGVPGVFTNTKRCTSAAPESLPLGRRGLAGPPYAWEKRVDCSVAGRVLVRVRAELQTPAGWARASDMYHGARSRVVRAQVAVAAHGTLRPMAYAEIAGNGAVRLWSAQTCV